jgi:hypothetical protein
MKDLTRDQFADWLQKYPPNADVGQARSTFNCPLANAWASIHETAVSVRGETVGDLSTTQETHELADWQKQFVACIDKYAAFFNADDASVTAAQALAMLQMLEVKDKLEAELGLLVCD